MENNMAFPKPLNHYQRNRVSIEFDPEEERTKQSHKDECDINQILEKFRRTGIITHQAKYAPMYGDAISVDEYQDAQFKIAEANSMYEELPAHIRQNFTGPEDFLGFVTDPENETKMREMGLLPKKPPEATKDSTPTDDKKPAAEPQKSAKKEPEANKGDPEQK